MLLATKTEHSVLFEVGARVTFSASPGLLLCMEDLHCRISFQCEACTLVDTAQALDNEQRTACSQKGGMFTQGPDFLLCAVRARLPRPESCVPGKVSICIAKALYSRASRRFLIVQSLLFVCRASFQALVVASSQWFVLRQHGQIVLCLQCQGRGVGWKGVVQEREGRFGAHTVGL